MSYFAVITDNGELIGIFAAFGGLLVGFYAFATKQMRDARDERKDERDTFNKTLDKVARASEHVAEATSRAADEAKQRNGHLADLVIEQREHMKFIANQTSNTILDGVQHIQEQHIEKQRIDKQTINKVDTH